jgi:hypothetical protein
MPVIAKTQVDPEVEKKFRRLSKEWKEQVQVLSSTTEMCNLPSYQKIIGMGQPVVPLLLRELQTDPHHWFWALKAITEADPVPPENRGRVREMIDAWIKWGVENGHL